MLPSLISLPFKLYSKFSCLHVSWFYCIHWLSLNFILVCFSEFCIYNGFFSTLSWINVLFFFQIWVGMQSEIQQHFTRYTFWSQIHHLPFWNKQVSFARDILLLVHYRWNRVKYNQYHWQLFVNHSVCNLIVGPNLLFSSLFDEF